MAAIALTDAFVYLSYLDLSVESNEVMLNLEATTLESQTFGDTWAENTIGVKSGSCDIKGFLDTTMTSDAAAFLQQALGPLAETATLGLVQTEDMPAYIFQGKRAKYSFGGAHGTVAPVEVSIPSTGKVVRGKLAKEKGNVSATGALGTGLLLGAVSATQYLYASFHVFTAGTTITIVVESDDNAGFTTATTRGTFGPLTTVGGNYLTPVAGAITDTYWRFRVTACTGTFNVAGAIAIGS
jgi:hypothetical protein